MNVLGDSINNKFSFFCSSQVSLPPHFVRTTIHMYKNKTFEVTSKRDDTVTKDQAEFQQIHDWACDGLRFLFKELNKQGKELDEIVKSRKLALTWVNERMNPRRMQQWKRVEGDTEEVKWKRVWERIGLLSSK
eukprot:SAG11_NODE_3795_length_2220_cov_237.444130_2_plen_133_part_00